MKRPSGKPVLVMILLALFFALAPVVAADTAPKPSLSIRIEGVEGAYRWTYLFRHVADPEPLSVAEMAIGDRDQNPLLVALNGYRDPDGYVALNLYWSPMYDGMPVIYNGYPNPVKVAVMTPEGKILISEAVTHRLFDAVVVFDFGGHEAIADPGVPVAFGNGYEVIPVADILVDFLLRVLATIAVELAVLFAFGYRRKRTFLAVAGLNVLTQSVLTAVILYADYYWQRATGPNTPE